MASLIWQNPKVNAPHGINILVSTRYRVFIGMFLDADTQNDPSSALLDSSGEPLPKGWYEVCTFTEEITFDSGGDIVLIDGLKRRVNEPITAWAELPKPVPTGVIK